MAEQLTEEEIWTAFRIHDPDDTGFITSANLRFAMSSLGEQCTDDEFDEMIREAGQDGDGRIDYNEFIQVMMQK